MSFRAASVTCYHCVLKMIAEYFRKVFPQWFCDVSTMLPILFQHESKVSQPCFTLFRNMSTLKTHMLSTMLSPHNCGQQRCTPESKRSTCRAKPRQDWCKSKAKGGGSDSGAKLVQQRGETWATPVRHRCKTGTKRCNGGPKSQRTV